MTGPGQSPDMPQDIPTGTGGLVRTPPDTVQTAASRDVLSRQDTVRTRPDSEGPDTADSARIAYGARVPRRLLGGALAEVLARITREMRTPRQEQAHAD